MPDRATPFPRAFWKRPRRPQNVSEATYQGRRAILLQDPCAVCGGSSVDVHHRKRRSQGGDHRWSNLMPVCRWCHDAIGRYPGYAHQAGYSVLRHEDPRQIRVLRLSELPTAARLRFTKPLIDHRLMRDAVEAQGLGPEWGQA